MVIRDALTLLTVRKFRAAFIITLATFLTSCCLCPDPEPKITEDSTIRLNDISTLYRSTNDEKLPKFSCIQDVKTKKMVFFGYILQFVREHNAQILETRTAVSALEKKLNNTPSSQENSPSPFSTQEQQWLAKLAKQHRVKVKDINHDFFDQLLARLDIIPASMALAQAANESAWGTSRFALQANNLFGQWCFTPGCGVVPQQRPEDATYEVKLFSTPSEAVGQYMLNINRNRSYEKVRNIRQSYRSQGQPISGNSMAGGLEHYSARGDAYIEELRSMIGYNKLSQWDILDNSYPDISLITIPNC